MSVLIDFAALFSKEPCWESLNIFLKYYQQDQSAIYTFLLGFRPCAHYQKIALLSKLKRKRGIVDTVQLQLGRKKGYHYCFKVAITI